MVSASVREIGENIKNSASFKGSVEYGVMLCGLTTMAVGGPAAVLVEPSDASSARTALREACRAGKGVFILGGGSNVVASDGGYSGVVVSTVRMDGIRAVYAGEGRCSVSAGCGAKTDSVVEFCAAHGIAGMEAFAALPGTIGGACFMNARCYSLSMGDVVSAVRFLDSSDGWNEADYRMDRSDWAYKRSPFAGGGKLICEVELSLPLAEGMAAPPAGSAVPEAPLSVSGRLRAAGEAYRDDRREKGHFRFPSAGSFFKNDRSFGKPSGAIIDSCGLKGLSQGKAQVAPWHGNIIINTGGATAADVMGLAGTVRDVVREKTGLCLEREVIFFGD